MKDTRIQWEHWCSLRHIFNDCVVQICLLHAGGNRLMRDWKNYTHIAAKLLAAVVTSAEVECIFSTFGYIHSNIRNRLGIEKAVKLVPNYSRC